MYRYLILCRSLTYAQRAARLLERAGMTVTLMKTPQQLTTGGCGYAVGLRKAPDAAVRVLADGSIPFGRVYEREESGEYREVSP